MCLVRSVACVWCSASSVSDLESFALRSYVGVTALKAWQEALLLPSVAVACLSGGGDGLSGAGESKLGSDWADGGLDVRVALATAALQVTRTCSVRDVHVYEEFFAIQVRFCVVSGSVLSGRAVL
jgi:hypothetical protein